MFGVLADVSGVCLFPREVINPASAGLVSLDPGFQRNGLGLNLLLSPSRNLSVLVAVEVIVVPIPIPMGSPFMGLFSLL